ncbi:hypothetical protein BLNAU_793 [Blattamonas nauphoetae]|uniref:Uncharacterized protein n=1 Tax=Blattamonas nauphoetae TaxID=2049346 RepID=A0ABQ9YKI1_9EUKA|nr:hypothetical protein BLNAU_793 [Blattamonas nauphoetae]
MSHTKRQSPEDVQQQIDMCLAKIDVCIGKQQYVECDKLQKKVDELRKQLSTIQKTAISKDYKKREQELEQTYQDMVQQFAEEWDHAMVEFEENANTQIANLKQQHSRELEDYAALFDSQKEHEMIPSQELANLRATERQLVKLRKFLEAQKAKTAADELEAREIQKYEQSHKKKKSQALLTLQSQQDVEMNGLIRRLEKERKEKMIQRTNDAARLEQRYRNVLRQEKSELRSKELQHSTDEKRQTNQLAGTRITSAFPKTPTKQGQKTAK